MLLRASVIIFYIVSRPAGKSDSEQQRSRLDYKRAAEELEARRMKMT